MPNRGRVAEDQEAMLLTPGGDAGWAPLAADSGGAKEVEETGPGSRLTELPVSTKNLTQLPDL